MLSNRMRVICARVGVAAGVAMLASIATAEWFGESEQPITGVAYERASAAAIAYVGGGRVTETEVGDEESYYEVEVTLEDGTEIDVQLDQDFNVVGQDGDAEIEDEDEEDEDAGETV